MNGFFDPAGRLAAALGVALWVTSGLAGAEPPVPSTPEGCAPTSPRCHDWVELVVRDVIPLKEVQTHAVVLVSRQDGTILPLFVDETAAIAIAFRLARREAPHPLAQDLLDALVTELGGQLAEVRIDEIHGHVYKSHVLIQQGARRVSIEARPSDAVSMALTARAPVYAARRVLAEAGISKLDIDQLRARIEPGTGGSAPVPGPQDPTIKL